MPDAAVLLRQYLAQLADRGVTHVPLTGIARQRITGTPASPAPPTVPATGMPATTVVTVPDKSARLAALAAEADKSPACRGLGTLRDTMVFAKGSADAELMFIGEAPGAEEERQGEPFVGPAGQLLTKIIQAMGFKSGEIYISNICKFRPIVEDGRPQGSRNRPPTRLEMDTCLPFITEEIRIIQPRLIVALGATASTGLGIEGTVGRLRGQFHEFQGIPVMVTYHPSYLLRCEQDDGGGIREKRLVWEDLLLVMERLGITPSPKQRAYFTKAKS
jgi:uracil-DNA glycosylase